MKFHLNRVKVNRHGYDSGGRFWGTGLPLWHAWTSGDEPTFERYFHAVDRSAAREALTKEFEGCSFYHK